MAASRTCRIGWEHFVEEAAQVVVVVVCVFLLFGSTSENKSRLVNV